MRRTILMVSFIIAAGAAFSVPAAAQCDRNAQSPIRCGYYDEGYQDGAQDAQAGQQNNYRRFSNKYERQYESFYRDGYNAGYASSSPVVGQWNFAQRAAYDLGYNFGQNDRSANRASSPQQNESRASAVVRPYFMQGYLDGYSGTPRRYNFPIGQAPGPGFPGGPGTGSGTATWAGRVDNQANIILQGNVLRAVDLTNSGLTTTQQFVNGSLPRRNATVSVRKINGRGTATVMQQPSRFNNYEAVVRISDPRSGADNYGIEISWTSANVIEDYQSGSATWRGRVDQTVNITVSGADVFSEVVAGNALSNVQYNVNGYLARRPGSVTVRKRDGRGTVTVLQQPSAVNDYTAVIQIFDPQGGADNYHIDINW
ncbi:MAG: hypothetical protein H0V76_04840 [Blastocatellia bacterium]|nr:hypothetical protein [Blastocatellia bacterium]